MSNKETWSTGLEISKPASRDGSPNVCFGKGCHMVGTFDLQGEARIRGNVEGEIVSRDELVIEEAGVVNAKIFGKRVKIFGRVQGDIQCEERLELHAGACVNGNLFSPIIVINEGVAFEGKCSMKNAGKANKTRPERGATERAAVVTQKQVSSLASQTEFSADEKLVANTEQD